MRAGQDVLSKLRAALGTEWVLPHGTGGSSSGTASGANARRAHALLAAADRNGRRTALLLKMDEKLRGPGVALELGCSVLADGSVRPAGHLLLERFTLDPWPRWTWRASGVALEKSLVPISGHDAVAIRYRLLEGPLLTLTVSPLVAARDLHAIQRQSRELHIIPQGVPGRVHLQLAPDRPPLVLWHNGAFLPARVWQLGLAYPLDPEATEGEDAFIPGHIEAGLSPGVELHVVAAADSDLFRALAREDRLGAPPPRTLAECVRILEAREREQHMERGRAALAAAAVTAAQAAEAREGAASPAEKEQAATAGAPLGGPHIDGAAGRGSRAASAERHADDAWTEALAGIVLSGLTRTARGLTIVGSLPAGGERVATTLRVIPGLLTLRAFDAAREILVGAAEHLDEGVAPESFDPDDGTPRYGDPAPSLWLVHGAELYARRSGDLEFVRDALYAQLESVIQSFRAGTRHGIRAAADGLLAAGERGERRADLNALWYHALVAMAQLAKKTERKEAAAFYLAWAREHQTRFNELLWDEARLALHDALDDKGPVRGLSPAQLLAARVAPPVLAPERIAPLVRTIERALFTPLGLRESARETRAHTAWLGPWCSAYLRAHGRSAEAQARVREWLGELRARLALGASGTLPEWYEVPPGPEAHGGTARDGGAARAKRRSARGRSAGRRDPAEDGHEVAGADSGTPAPVSDPHAGPAPAGGDAVSILAASELLTVWIEELDHAVEPAAIITG